MVKGTQDADELGEVEEGATRLFGLQGLKVLRVVVDAGGERVVHAVTSADQPRACPLCGVVSTSR